MLFSAGSVRCSAPLSHRDMAMAWWWPPASEGRWASVTKNAALGAAGALEEVVSTPWKLSTAGEEHQAEAELEAGSHGGKGASLAPGDGAGN